MELITFKFTTQLSNPLNPSLECLQRNCLNAIEPYHLNLIS